MRGLYFPASNVVFAGQTDDPATIPRDMRGSVSTDLLRSVFGGWEAVENSALAMAEATPLLLLVQDRLFTPLPAVLPLVEQPPKRTGHVIIAGFGPRMAGIAGRYGAGVDIHLHDPGEQGTAQIRMIAERTRALGLGGKVAVSHAFCLGMVDEPEVGRLIDLLREERIAIMTTAPGDRPTPPVRRLREAGVTVGAGSDGVRDAWTPFGNADMLERAMLIALLADIHANREALAACLDDAERAASTSPTATRRRVSVQRADRRDLIGPTTRRPAQHIAHDVGSMRQRCSVRTAQRPEPCSTHHGVGQRQHHLVLGHMTEMAFDADYWIAREGGLRLTDIRALNHHLQRTLRSHGGDCVHPIELVHARIGVGASRFISP